MAVRDKRRDLKFTNWSPRGDEVELEWAGKDCGCVLARGRPEKKLPDFLHTHSLVAH